MHNRIFNVVQFAPNCCTEPNVFHEHLFTRNRCAQSICNSTNMFANQPTKTNRLCVNLVIDHWVIQPMCHATIRSTILPANPSTPLNEQFNQLARHSANLQMNCNQPLIQSCLLPNTLPMVRQPFDKSIYRTTNQWIKQLIGYIWLQFCQSFCQPMNTSIRLLDNQWTGQIWHQSIGQSIDQINNRLINHLAILFSKQSTYRSINQWIGQSTNQLFISINDAINVLIPFVKSRCPQLSNWQSCRSTKHSICPSVNSPIYLLIGICVG